MQVYESIAEVTGDTPLVRLRSVTRGVAKTPNVLAKVEYMNPGGSVKDRIALRMIEAAEREGKIAKGGTIIEPTSGNTGVGLAIVANDRGYKCVFVCPDKVAQEPDRFAVAAAGPTHRIPVFGAVARPFRRRLAVIVVLAFAVSVVTGPANSFVFLFAQSFLHQSGVVTVGMVLGAGVAGLAGLLAGRWLADRMGRRLTGTLAMVAVALLAILTYTGSAPALVTGYILGVFSASVFAPATGALTSELFPTSVRASVVGWSLAAGVLGAVAGLIVFGSVARAGHPFAVAALVTFLPAVPVMGLFWLLPETRGREPEDLWPDL